MSGRSLRRALVALTTVLIAVVAVGCSAPAENAGGEVQINLPDGRSVTIPEAPTRIVTLGGQWTDVLLSFGVTPVGYFDSAQALSGKTAPWYGDKLNDVPTLDPNDEIVAKIAALKPDLIVAPGFAAMSGEFDKLTKIAPTLDKISGEQIDPWEDMVTLMGTILHKPEKAKHIIDGVNAKISRIVADNPGLKSKTYALAYMYGADQLSVLGDAKDGAGQVFTSLGLVMAPRLAQQAASTGQPRLPVSVENLPWLNADLLVMATETEALRNRLKGLPSFQNLTSVKAGAVVFMSQVDVTGLNEPSPTALPYALGLIEQALAKAAAE